MIFFVPLLPVGISESYDIGNAGGDFSLEQKQSFVVQAEYVVANALQSPYLAAQSFYLSEGAGRYSQIGIP